MSIFSARGDLTRSQADEYAAALLHLVGTQDPMEVLRATPGALRRELDHIPASQLGTPEAPGKWSARVVIAHLADSELAEAYRLRMVLASDHPTIVPSDQDQWATGLHYERTDVTKSLERFSLLRQTNLDLWANASPDDLARVGIHGERGPENVERMRHLHAGHDLAHLRQLARIRILLTGH